MHLINSDRAVSVILYRVHHLALASARISMIYLAFRDERALAGRVALRLEIHRASGHFFGPTPNEFV